MGTKHETDKWISDELENDVVATKTIFIDKWSLIIKLSFYYCYYITDYDRTRMEELGAPNSK